MPEKGEGLELRLLVKLRVQNPNSTPVGYDGAYVKVEVQDRTFASGVTNAGGNAKYRTSGRDEHVCSRRSRSSGAVTSAFT